MIVRPSDIVETPKQMARGPYKDPAPQITCKERNRYVIENLAQRGLIHTADVSVLISRVISNEELEPLLLGKYGIQKVDLGTVLSTYYRRSYYPYEERAVLEPDLLKDLRQEYLRKNAWIPVKRQGTIVDVVMNDPDNVDQGFDIRRAFPGCTIRLSFSLRCDIDLFLAASLQRRKQGSIATILGELVKEADLAITDEMSVRDIDENDSAIVRLSSQIIAEADRLGASDVHIEPYSDQKETAIRFRVDGSCFTYMRIPAAYRRAIVSRFKIMASLDIAERRKPQDGKIRYRLSKDREIELRVATLPTAGANEDVVMRLLTAKGGMALESMDFAPHVLGTVQTLARQPHGMILCVGPTGSGKTTTLHAVLKHINTDERKIWTAEDPVEITQDGLRQVQIQPKIGFTFAAAMRAFLRADPDVILIGEMRDKETADIALQASLTGHLVLSTLHTNSAVETIIRLLDMGCDPFNFADAMRGVLAQRLCKRLCSQCKEAYHPTRQEFYELIENYGSLYWTKRGSEYADDLLLYRGRGCETCNGTGFKGRVALHELLVGSEAIQKLIHARAKTFDIIETAMQEGMVTLVQDGIHKVLQGLTTYRQVRAVAMK